MNRPIARIMKRIRASPHILREAPQYTDLTVHRVGDMQRNTSRRLRSCTGNPEIPRGLRD